MSGGGNIKQGQTLGDFARNPDGQTYDGRKVAQFLFEAMTGKPLSEEEAQAMVDEAKRRKAERSVKR